MNTFKAALSKRVCTMWRCASIYSAEMHLRRTISSDSSSSSSSSINDAATVNVVKDVNEKSNKTTMTASASA